MPQTNPKLSPLVNRFNSQDPKFLSEFRSFLRKYSVSELGRMTISFLDFQHLQQSTFVQNEPETGEEKNPAFDEICERDSSRYSFSEWPPVPGFITGKALFDQIRSLLPGVK